MSINQHACGPTLLFNLSFNSRFPGESLSVPPGFISLLVPVENLLGQVAQVFHGLDVLPVIQPTASKH